MKHMKWEGLFPPCSVLWEADSTDHISFSSSGFHLLPAERDYRAGGKVKLSSLNYHPSKPLLLCGSPLTPIASPSSFWVLVSTPSPWPSDLEVVMASCCCMPWDVFHLQVFFNPTYTFANGPFIKISLVTPAWVYCLFPLCVCWGNWGDAPIDPRTNFVKRGI